MAKVILFSGLACDYSQKPANLLLFPSVECWNSHTPLAIIAIILIVVFTFVCLFSGLTFYDHDPTVLKTYPYINKYIYI